jgi:glycosyltransferase involved in cell wall biosynthesis
VNQAGPEAHPLVVVCFTGNSGLTDYAASFCREVDRSRNVVLLTAGSIEPVYRELGFPVETVFRRSRHYPIDLLRFLRRVVELRPEVVLFQGPLKFAFLDGLAVRYLRARGIRVAVVVHDVVPHNERAVSTAALHFYYRSFPQLVVHSDDAVPRLRAAGVRGETITVPHGRYDIFDVDGLTRDDARAALGIEAAMTVALFFGNLEERKGLGVVIDAAERSRDESLLFLAAGQDFLTPQAPRELRDAVRGARDVRGLRVDVGRVPHRDVQKYFRAADVVVLPYLEGSTSGVLKLALAFGIPVVATDVGDIRQELTAENGRLLVGTPTPGAILEAIAATKGEQVPDVDPRLSWSRITPKVISFLLPGHPGRKSSS